MPEMSKGAIELNLPAAAPGEPGFCTGAYALKGPQVEPESSWWLDKCDIVNRCTVPRPVTLAELAGKFPGGFTHYPTDAATLKAEIEELILLSRQRDEPVAIAHDPRRNPQGKPLPITSEPEQLRLP